MSSSALKLVCLNIEIDRHLDRIIPFLKKEKPDVILLQEVLEKDLPLLESALHMKSVSTPLAQIKINNAPYREGLAILTHLPITNSYVEYYRGHKNFMPTIELGPRDAGKILRALMSVHVVKEGINYCLATTHFTWTPDGKPSAEQAQDLERMLHVLSRFSDIIFCGDFNAPRGTVIFDTLASKFRDNIPAHITTTIDKNWHRAGDLQLVVDGLFTSPHYHVDSIDIVDNVSDHCAIVAHVKRSV